MAVIKNRALVAGQKVAQHEKRMGRIAQRLTQVYGWSRTGHDCRGTPQPPIHASI